MMVKAVPLAILVDAILILSSHGGFTLVACQRQRRTQGLRACHI